MLNKKVFFLLFALFCLDLAYSFFQHYSMPLDGDIAGGVVPSNDVKKILSDPFGFSVVKSNSIYPNPNRFFAHWIFFEYFNIFPLLLQYFFSPITSVYLSCALAKIIIQFSLITIITFYILGENDFFSRKYILVALIISPLFQTNGYRSFMGIIDPSITYTFFYALPTLFVLIFYFPFYKYKILNSEYSGNNLVFIWLLFLSIIISFNGALNPGIVLIIALLNIIFYYREKTTFKGIFNSRLSIIYLGLVVILSIYSIYISKNNSIFKDENATLLSRYKSLPVGLYNIFTVKIGWIILILTLIINFVIIRKGQLEKDYQNLTKLIKWILFFSIFYIVLLPLGGYKNYRPNIIRYDTFLPITICTIFLFGKTTFLILTNLNDKSARYYTIFISCILIVFTFADKPEFDKNGCEKNALNLIATSGNEIVELNSVCTIMSWEKTTNFEDSYLNSLLLERWNICKKKKLYFQK